MNLRFGSSVGLLMVCACLCGCGTADDAFQGYIEGEFVYVASPIAGALTELAVARGDTVEAGAQLFALDREPESAALQEAEMALSRARAELENRRKGARPSELSSLEAQRDRAAASLTLSESELVRATRLHGAEDGLISDEELDRAQANRDADRALLAQVTADLRTGQLGAREDEIRAAEAYVGALEATRARAQWAFDQKRQSAPTGARVDDTLYRPGEFVAAGRPVVVLLPPENLKVRFFVSEPELSRFRPGIPVDVAIDGAAKTFRGTVSFISGTAEFTPPVIYSQQNRAKLVYMIEAEFSPADARALRPGQPVDVSLPPGEE